MWYNMPYKECVYCANRQGILYRRAEISVNVNAYIFRLAI